MSKGGSFTTKFSIGNKKVSIHYDSTQSEYSWECGNQCSTGFATMEEAETDALFWTTCMESYLLHYPQTTSVPEYTDESMD